jgi:hypothetical protein
MEEVMIKCPECWKMAKGMGWVDEDKTCEHCGCFLDNPPRPKPEPKEKPKP